MKKRAPAAPAVVPCDPRQWSASSRCSHGASIQAYRDRPYRCRCCGQAAVFSALEQQIAFEIRKVYIHQQRVLCPACFAEGKLVQQRVAACEAQWAAEKARLMGDAAFLRGWRDLLLLRERYGARPHGALKAMLGKLLAILPVSHP